MLLLAFVLLGPLIASAFTEDPDLLRVTTHLLYVAAAFQIADGVQVVGGGLMRGMGNPKAGAIVNLIGFYAIGLPLGWLLAFPLELGLVGIWWGLAAGLGGVAAMLVVWVARTAARPIAQLRVAVD